MKVLTSFCLLAFAALAATGQSKIAFVDSEYIYSLYPEFASVQQQLDRLANQWADDLQERQRVRDDLFEEYQARELLYTHEERRREQEAIMQAEEELDNRRMQYFGPEGELYRQQDRMLRPIQEKVLIAIEAVAEAEGYDFVFDRSGDYVFLFADEGLNISDLVLEELGIDVSRVDTPGGLNRQPSESAPRSESGRRSSQYP